MNTESIKEYLARGGNIKISNEESSLEKLLYNEGLLDHQDVAGVKNTLHKAITDSLNNEFQTNKS
jgi:hypothetical protein